MLFFASVFTGQPTGIPDLVKQGKILDEGRFSFRGTELCYRPFSQS